MRGVDFGKLRSVPSETLVICNPASAGGATGRRVDALRRQLEARLDPFDFVSTDGPRHAEHIAAEASRASCSRILIAGGDGTTHEVVSGILGTGVAPEDRPTIGLLPLGSGWDLARSLDLPRDVEGAIDVIARATTRCIDAGCIEYQNDEGLPCRGYFANESSAGLSAATIRLVGRSSKRLGPRLGFIAGAVAAIVTHRPADLAIEIDGERLYEGPVSMVVAANGAYFGAGMKVAPDARVDDAALEVILVRGLSIPRLLANLPSFYSGGHLRHPRVSRHRARQLMVIPKEAGSPIDVDGESLGMLPLRAEILPSALRVFAPTPNAG